MDDSADDGTVTDPFGAALFNRKVGRDDFPLRITQPEQFSTHAILPCVTLPSLQPLAGQSRLLVPVEPRASMGGTALGTQSRAVNELVRYYCKRFGIDNPFIAMPTPRLDQNNYGIFSVM